jgi:hypothetical protein
MIERKLSKVQFAWRTSCSWSTQTRSQGDLDEALMALSLSQKAEPLGQVSYKISSCLTSFSFFYLQMSELQLAGCIAPPSRTFLKGGFSGIKRLCRLRPLPPSALIPTAILPVHRCTVSCIKEDGSCHRLLPTPQRTHLWLQVQNERLSPLPNSSASIA